MLDVTLTFEVEVNHAFLYKELNPFNLYLMRLSFADLMKRLFAKKGTSIPNFDVTLTIKT